MYAFALVGKIILYLQYLQGLRYNRTLPLAVLFVLHGVVDSFIRSPSFPCTITLYIHISQKRQTGPVGTLVRYAVLLDSDQQALPSLGRTWGLRGFRDTTEQARFQELNECPYCTAVPRFSTSHLIILHNS